MNLSLQLNDTYLGLDNITAVLQKTQFVTSKLENGIPLSDRLFDPNVWMKFVENISMEDMNAPMVPGSPDG